MILISLIAPVLILLAALVYLDLRPRASPPGRKAPCRPEKPPAASEDEPFFESGFSPYAYSGLSLLKHLAGENVYLPSARQDIEIAERVRVCLREEPALKQAEAQVRCHFGRVVLEGRVMRPAHRVLAESLAASTEGVLDVSNRLFVDAQLAEDSIPRTGS